MQNIQVDILYVSCAVTLSATGRGSERVSGSQNYSCASSLLYKTFLQTKNPIKIWNHASNPTHFCALWNRSSTHSLGSERLSDGWIQYVRWILRSTARSAQQCGKYNLSKTQIHLTGLEESILQTAKGFLSSKPQAVKFDFTLEPYQWNIHTLHNHQNDNKTILKDQFLPEFLTSPLIPCSMKWQCGNGDVAWEWRSRCMYSVFPFGCTNDNDVLRAHKKWMVSVWRAWLVSCHTGRYCRFSIHLTWLTDWLTDWRQKDRIGMGECEDTQLELSSFKIIIITHTL